MAEVENRNEISSEELKQSYERIFQELNEVQAGLNGKERIEGLGGILTKTLFDELGKKNNEETRKALEKAFQTVKSNPELRNRAGEGFKALEAFFEPDADKKQKMETKLEEKEFKDYSEFMEKLKHPESLSGMTREEVDRVKLYLENKNNYENAYKMYVNMRVIKQNGVELKRQDKEFFDGVWNTLEANYKDNDYFMGEEYGEIDFSDIKLFKNLLNEAKQKTWSGEDIGIDDIVSRTESIINRQRVVDKFNRMNQERKDKNKKCILENIKIDQELIKNVAAAGVNQNFLLQVFLGMQIEKFDEEGKIQLADKKEIELILKDLAKEIMNRVNVQVNQFTDNNINRVDGVLLEKINALNTVGKGNEFIVKNGENVTYYPDRAANYLNNLRGAGIKWGDLEKQSVDNGARQAWIAAVQVLLNSDKSLGAPIQVTGTYEAKVDDPTYARVMEFQRRHTDKFGVDKERGWKVDGKPGQNVISVLVEDQRINEQNQKAKEMADAVQKTLNPYECQPGEREKYNIPTDVPTFKTKGLDGTPGTANLDAIFYRTEDNKIYRVGFDTPWEKSQSVYSLLENGSIPTLKDKAPILMNHELNVYDGGAKALTEQMQKLDTNITVEAKDGKYLLKNGEVTISIDSKDSELFGKDGFCGKTEILDRIKLVALASQVKEQFGNGEVNKDDIGIKMKDAPDNITPTQHLVVDEKYGLNGQNYNDFLRYCNNLVLNSNVYVPNSLNQVVVDDAEINTVNGRQQNGKNAVPSGDMGGFEERKKEKDDLNKGNSGANNEPPFRSPEWYARSDPEHATDYGLTYLGICSNRMHDNRGIPLNSFVYTSKEYPNTYFYKAKDQRYIFMAVERNCPYIRTQLTYKSYQDKTPTISREFNVCDEGVKTLSRILGQNLQKDEDKGYYKVHTTNYDIYPVLNRDGSISIEGNSGDYRPRTAFGDHSY